MASFSYIVPAFNAEFFVLECLESIERSWHEDDELIVVDDCSSDATVLVVQRFLERNPNRGKLVRCAVNVGPANAREQALSLASKDYIVFVDADDALMDGSILQVRESLAKHPVNILVADFFYKDERGQITRSASLSHVPRTVLSDAQKFLANGFNDGKFYFWNHVFERNFLSSVLPNLKSGKYFEDLTCIPMIILDCKSFFYLDLPVLCYRQHGSSITSAFSVQKCLDLSSALEQTKRRLLTMEVKEELLVKYNVFCLRVVFWVLDNWLKAGARAVVPHQQLTGNVLSSMTMPVSVALKELALGRGDKKIARKIRFYLTMPNLYIKSRAFYFSIKKIRIAFRGKS